MAKSQADKDKERNQGESQGEGTDNSSQEAVETPGVVEVVEAEVRPSQLARSAAFSPTPSVEEGVVYGQCSMCTNLAPHEGPTNVRCPRCGLQPAAL